MSDVEIQVKVSCALIADIKNKLNFSPEMPANYAVDSALRKLKEILEKQNGGA
jgi:hypothetical protein